MSKHIRLKSQAASIFFTVALADRGSDLLLREVERLRQAVRVTKAARPFVIEAWVVLPDHLHAIWTLPAGDGDFATRWRLIKTQFSAGLPKGLLTRSLAARRERGVWQRRFWEHHLRDEQDRAAHLRFCQIDPVRHGLVDDPAEWPYSSFNHDIGLRRAG
jgi:putative transposase